MTHRDFDGLIEAGWTEQQAIEAVHIVGLFEYFNRVADGLGLESHSPEQSYVLEHLHAGPMERTE